jgi:hypothetical protein
MKLGLGAGLSYIARSVIAQPDFGNILKPSIWPTGKWIDYSVAQSPLVNWEAVPRKFEPTKTTTYGFLEGLATERVLPVVLPLNIGTVPNPWFGRDEMIKGVPAFPRSGLYVAFEVGVGMMSLPRRDKKEDGLPAGRHDHFDSFALGPNRRNQINSDSNFIVPLAACVTKIDHREIRLITDKKTYVPDEELWHVFAFQHGLYGPGDLYDPTRNEGRFYGRPPVPTCSRRDVTATSARIEFIMRFDTGSTIPMQFRLELPQLEVMGKSIPMPTPYFEPYDIVNNKWV